MLLDEVMPDTSFQVVVHEIVAADRATTWEAIFAANLAADPAMRVLSAVREAPNRIVGWWRGEAREPMPDTFTFADIGDVAGWVTLAEDPPNEHVAGAVGRFWERDYGWVDVEPDEFAGYAEPGHAKTAVGFSLRDYGAAHTLLSYDSRTTCTDEDALRRFRRYWLLLRPFLPVIMGRASRAIGREAEQRAGAAADVDLAAAERAVT